MKIYLFAFMLLTLYSCKKENLQCVHDSTLEGEERTVPQTRSEIVASLNGEWHLQRIQCGWGREEPVNDCISVLFGANSTFKTYKNGEVIEEGAYTIIEKTFENLKSYSIETPNSIYLTGDIWLDGSGRVISCGTLSSDGCNCYFKKG